MFYRTDLGVTAVYTTGGWKELINSPSSAIQSMVGWAASKLPNDNDVIYIRRKNDRLFWIEGNNMGGNSWKEIDGSAVLPTGLKQQIIEGPDGQSIVEDVVTTHIPSGWYQDASANLYLHEGLGQWADVSNTQGKKLTALAESGKMEYLG
jgi:hypothetical protein